jgi:uncharacterized membrane protein required for colicin V production
MVSLHIIFWLFVLLFALIGAMRGWARELLVTFAVVLALFILSVLERFVPFIRDILAGDSPRTLFWLRTMVLLALVFFGYQTPNLPRLAGSNRFARERLQDTLLGFFIGALNGFLIFGSIWYYLNDANYPFPIVTPPIPGTAGGDAAARLMPFLPPHWLTSPTIYFAVAIAFIFVLVVFL